MRSKITPNDRDRFKFRVRICYLALLSDIAFIHHTLSAEFLNMLP
jgi:hypothetical protein